MKIVNTPRETLSARDLVNILAGSSSAACRGYIHIGQFFRSRGHSLLAKIISRRLRRYGLYIAHSSEIHNSVKFPHPTAIVIGSGAKIEENVQIFQGVTIGGARIGDHQTNSYPTICKGTVIFAGAVVVGKIRIGENCIVGANSVVLNDIPDNSVCAGAPAKVVRQNVSPSNGDAR